MGKVLVFGIDGMPPELVFNKWINDLPNIKKLMNSGIYAKMESTIPPSTIVAWNAMISGKDTSEIGVFSYTFKDKLGKPRLVSSKNVKCDLIWDILDKNDKKTVALYVPLSYPVKAINGTMVSGFLTPNVNDKCAYPQKIVEKIKKLKNPELFFDVAVELAGHKNLDPSALISRTYEMTNMQIELLKDVLINEDWDFFMSVMIGSDRLQHMLWRHFDETHRKHIPNSPHKSALKNYYIHLDQKIGEILELIDKDTTLIIASDHGMAKQEGKININNWLIKEGHLVLKENIDLTSKKRFNINLVNMEKSTAYGGGAYNARVYLNKNNIQNIDSFRENLIKKIKEIPDDKGNKLNTQVYKKEEIYNNSSESGCPDLTIYFDDLKWASNPDLGQEGLYSWETAVGADNAGHSRFGCFIINGPQINNKGKISDVKIQQVLPTILKLLNVPIPNDVKINSIEVN